MAFVPHSTHLKAGDQAPAFEGKDQNGESISLDQFKGKKVVLYFYPKDNTPGCTAQACNLRDNYEQLLAQGYAVIGVSPDSEKKHQNFISKYELPFPLIADTEMEVIKAYDVWGPKKFMGREFDGLLRTTFVIDEAGTIAEVITKVKTKEHAAQVL
ncbi:thioredoxin-dependent thiol peroxidase [bacterium SCSIO 12741]|nr:thioredoxin-dependent thiol peroxidase [bacterium SCSIO 12741]